MSGSGTGTAVLTLVRVVAADDDELCPAVAASLDAGRAGPSLATAGGGPGANAAADGGGGGCACSIIVSSVVQRCGRMDTSKASSGASTTVKSPT